ncbi:MAG: hypothetical protein IID31_02180 [Planctomycetes bacterium]|nr:hypothetical protein [Planctomycetota bacterium]
MRLPLTKLYRAFPELDPFTDEQCLWYIARAKRKHKVRNAIALFGVVALGFPAWGLFALLAWPIVAWIGGRSFAAHRIPLGLLGFIIGVSAVLAAVCTMLARDRWLRWMIRKVLNRAVCPSCEYSLLGLRVENDGVVCPECGASLSLTTMGLTPEDLIAEVATP